MRLRFLAIAGPPEAVEGHARLHLPQPGSFNRIADAPGLGVWTPADVPSLSTADGACVAVGMVFERDNGHRLERLPSPLPPFDVFARSYWGAYVLIGAEGSGHFVVRDPSGAITAYHRSAGGLDFYASDFEMLDRADAGALAPDVEFLRDWLTYPYLRGNRTGIPDVEELVPGAVVTVRGGRTTRQLAWSPSDQVTDGADDDFEVARIRLRGALLLAVPRLAKGAGDVVLHLSGGLDSSIVAAALAESGCPFRAVTFATCAPDGDERAYARAVAHHCGVELAELLEDPVAPDFEHVPPPALRPPPNAPLRPLHRAFDDHLARTRADLALDGTGGDNVFCYLASASPALDALEAQGAHAAIRVLVDLARMHDMTAWYVGRAAWRRRWRRRETWQPNESFLSPGTARTEANHPWLDRPNAGLRGRFEQVQSIVGIRHFIRDSAPGSPAFLHPLLSQPVVEACLRIPSWLWVREGRDRAVARAAFKGLLPDTILARRSKGRLESMFVSGYMARLAQLERVLLEGRLAQAGLIDRAAIRTYLHRRRQPEDPGYIRLLELASAEAWLRSFDR